MAITVPCNTTRALTLTDFMEHIKSHVDPRDVDSIAACAPMLRALANDRTLVVDKLNDRIENSLAGGAIASTQTLLLARSDDFYVRANIWPAIADMANGRAYQDQVAYNLAHDHNFVFMTVGYLGPGYETEIYEYEYDRVEGYVGEPVDLRFLEKTRFASGMVMLYRANRDVHIQYPPEELTITLNLMISVPEVRIRDQYYFDVAKRAISGYPRELQASGRASFVNLAGYIGNDETQQLLMDLSAKHPCRRTRLAAFEALARHDPSSVSEIWQMAVQDVAPLVSNTARRKLGELESVANG